MEKSRTRDRIDIEKRTYSFSLLVIRYISSLKIKDASFEIIAKQLVRSATSVGANVAEAQAGSSRKDFKNFILHALKSANETSYWLKLLKDVYGLNHSIDSLIVECEELTKILGKIVSKLK